MITWLKNVLCGICMGIADAIPGVSGGTVALILGIYERFIAAISAIGPGMLKAVFSKAFWGHLVGGVTSPATLKTNAATDPVADYARHALFLATLVFGIAAAIVVGAKFIPDLIAEHPAKMNAFFFGLVIASIVIPFRMMGTRTGVHVVVFAIFAAATFFFVALPIDQSDKATGSVTVTLPAPAEADVLITPVGEATVFMTNRVGGTDKKREVAYLPTAPTVIAAGETTATIAVVARLTGDIANLPAGGLVASAGLPEGTTVTQAAPTSGGSDPALWFVFIAGMIAISAMVLPGISGSFILLMLGLYNYVFFNIRAFVYERDGDALVVLLVFVAALIIGIVSFARLVNWLLKNHRDVTLAALVGIMAGSLRKLWPWVTTNAEGALQATTPNNADGQLGLLIGLIVVGIVLVVGLERLGRGALAEHKHA